MLQMTDVGSIYHPKAPMSMLVMLFIDMMLSPQRWDVLTNLLLILLIYVITLYEETGYQEKVLQLKSAIITSFSSGDAAEGACSGGNGKFKFKYYWIYINAQLIL